MRNFRNNLHYHLTFSIRPFEPQVIDLASGLDPEEEHGETDGDAHRTEIVNKRYG